MPPAQLRRIDIAARADRHAWISAGRVYACVAADAGGLSHVGYHGPQPVSRNSIVLHRPGGAIALLLDGGDGALRPIPFDDVRWSPSACRIAAALPGAAMMVDIAVSERALRVTAALDAPCPGARFVLRLQPSPVYGDVRGERRWTLAVDADGALRIRVRDRILFREWIRRSGPYAGDFLLPEALRRRVFARRIRSGLATPADLRPDCADADFPIYDAAFFCVLRARTPVHTMDDGGAEWRFEAEQLASGSARVDLEFSDDAHDAPATVHAEAAAAASSGAPETPRLLLPAFPEVETFFNEAPGIVDSCWIRDLGMPRSTPGAYYWIWAWDTMATALLFPLWGWCERMHSVIDFIHAHRDEDGSIPMRWTRDLEALDSPGRGALDFLHAECCRRYRDAYGDAQPGRDAYGIALRGLRELAAEAPDGLVRSLGFYPDFPLAFGRTASSATAMETAAFACFCRIVAGWAADAGNEGERIEALAAAERSARIFRSVFWDDRGFFYDAVDTRTGLRNRSWPLFTLLALESTEGRAMVADRLRPMAAFLRTQLLTAEGLRLLPAWDPARASEAVTSAWYPYWDCHAVRVWRETGDAEAILVWLTAVENALARIGYCPEFLALDVQDDAARWTRHGAASNINCMAGWYRALLEGVAGIDTTGSAPAVLPLHLPLGTLRVEGLRFGTTTWDIEVHDAGHTFLGITVDGGPLAIDTVPPAACSDGGRHTLTVVYV